MENNVLTPEQIKLIREAEKLIPNPNYRNSIHYNGTFIIPNSELVNLQNVSQIESFVDNYIMDHFNDSCIDNNRYAKISDEDQLNAYIDQATSGCCGTFDAVILVNNEPYIVGANYGH